MTVERDVDELLGRLDGMSGEERAKQTASWIEGLAARVLEDDPNATTDDLQQALDEMIRHFRDGAQRRHCRASHWAHLQSGTA